MKITVKFNANKTYQRFLPNYRSSQFALDNQIIKDTAPYVPYKEGALTNSALRASQIGKGILVYNTPYARKLYYGDRFNFRKDRHPLATSHWFEHAKKAKKKTWIDVARKAGDFK